MFFDCLFNKMFFFTAYVNNDGSFPMPLSQEEERECLIRLKNGDEEAKVKLISHNLRLVAHIGKKYNNSADADDLISVGTIGLIKAISTFKMEKGVQLATYTARCIENEILMLLRANKKHKNNVSLNDPVGTDNEGNELALIDLLQSKEKSVIDEVENSLMYQKFREILKTELDEREYKIICLRYGINQTVARTQKEVAKIFGISRSYVSRIEKRAIEKIRDVININNFVL